MADTAQKAQTFRDMIGETMQNYIPAAGMGYGAPVGLTPEMMLETEHQRRATQAQQVADASNELALAQNASPQSLAPIGGTDPSNPDADPAMAYAQQANAGVPVAGLPATGTPYDTNGLRSFLEDQVSKASGAEDQARLGLASAYRTQGAGADAEIAGKQAELAAGVAEQQANQPLLAEKTEAQKLFEKQQQVIQQAGQRAYEAQMTRVNAAMMEASQAEMKSFWGDASTGAKILGVIAQALSGAANGLAGNPSAVTPLDRLIEQDMQRQEYNANQKNKAAYREQGMLSTIQKQTGDRLAAALATKIAAWDRIDRMVAENHNAIGGPTAQAQSQQLLALSQQRKGQLNEKLQSLMLENAEKDKQQALHSLGTLAVTGMANSSKLLAQKANHFTALGFVDDGTVNKSVYDKQAVIGQAYAKYSTAIHGMQRIAAQGMASNPVRQKAEYDKYMGEAIAAARKMDDTGAALSGFEQSTLLPRVPSFYDVMTPGLSSAKGGYQQLEDALDTVTESYIGQSRAAGVTSDLNPNDPIVGEHLTRYIQHHAKRGQ